ncbi:MAG: nitrous oxide reductase accessory protein NosL [Campylobacterota bacterium]|nr:nitrous oxide reductase accessory protein NosL [Campylobacterota bacterium]
MIKVFLGIILASSLLFSFEMDYDKDTTCVVRLLKVYKDPAWVAKIELKNGKKLFFSSPKSMFEFYFRPGKWYEIGVKSEKDFKDILVTDFKTLKAVKAKGAFYIYGTNVTGPAGDDLVAFDSYAAAEEFSKKHNGKRILGFRDVSDALVRLINGRI